MARLFWKFWFRIKHHIHYQGVKEIPDSGPVLFIAEWKEEADLLMVLAGLKRNPIPLVPENKPLAPCIRKKARLLPFFSDRSRYFHIRRMLKRLETIPLTGDLLIFPEGAKSPLIEAILKTEKKQIVFVRAAKSEVAFTAAPENFPFQGSAEEMNKYVKEWFALNQVKGPETKKEVDPQTQEIVFKELERLSGRPRAQIDLKMNLYEDLGLDSLDVTELIVFLEHRFQRKVAFEALNSVDNVVQSALGQEVRRLFRIQVEKRLLQAWPKVEERPDTVFPQGKTLPEFFLRTVERMGSSLACTDPNDTFSFIRLKTLALGLQPICEKLPGKTVGLMLPSLSYFNVMVMALMLDKKIPALLNWTLGPAHLEDAVQMGGIEAIISSGPLLEWMPYELPPSIVDKIVLMEEFRAEVSTEKRRKGIELARAKPDELMKILKLDEIKPSDTAVLLFTSGTEKKPKGVPLSHQNLLSNEMTSVANIEMTSRDVVLGILPPFHVFGFSIAHMVPLFTGCRAIYHPATLDLAAIASQIERWGATIICTAPTFLRALLALATKEQLRTVRLFIVGAEKAPDSLFEQVKALGTGAQILEGYGLTECSPIVTMNRLHQERQGVGFPLPGVEVKIVDPETKKPGSPGEAGLILVRGPNVFAQYLNGDKPFVDGWFNTGDIGALDAQGALHLTARLSRTVKIGGEMVSLPLLETEIVKRLSRDPPPQIAVVGEEVEEGGVHLVLYSNIPLEIEQVNHWLREAGFSNLLRVREVVHLQQLPLTATGKIDYKLLKKRG